MGPGLLFCGIGVGPDCSTETGVVGETLQQRAEFEEGGKRDLRFRHQGQARAPLARGHPLVNDAPDAIRQQTSERALPRGGDMLARCGEGLAVERVPGIVDGDRPWKLSSM